MYLTLLSTNIEFNLASWLLLTVIENSVQFPLAPHNLLPMLAWVASLTSNLHTSSHFYLTLFFLYILALCRLKDLYNK